MTTYYRVAIAATGLAVAGIYLILLVHPYLRPTSPAEDAISEQHFAIFVQGICLLYFTAWAIQMACGGPMLGIRAALNILAIIALTLLACWAASGDQAAYDAIRSTTASFDATSQLMFLYLVMVSIIVGWIWMIVILFRLGSRFGWWCRDLYERNLP